MAIEVKIRPYKYNFSGNTIHYRLYSAAAAADTAIYFEVRIKFRYQPDEYVELVTLPLYPTAGFASINIQDILNSKLEYERPALFDDHVELFAAYKQSGFFFIEFREITVDQQDTTWDSSEFDYVCGVTKGGLAYMRYRGNNFFINYWPLNDVYKFLTWQQSGRLANINEMMWLAFLNGLDDGSNNLQVVATVYYTDGTNDSVNHIYLAQPTSVVSYVPAGCTQWELHLLNADKKIHYWTIECRVDASAFSEVFRYYADNRKNYNDITLHYRGSLGGFDSVRIRGIIKHTLTYENVKQDRVFAPDYYNADEITPQQNIANNKELKTWAGDIGYLNKEEQDRLRDAQVQREVWWLKDKWWPVNVITGNISEKLSTDMKWSMPIEWTLGQDGDHYYTPDNVDVGVGEFTDNVCQAFPSDFEITIDTDSDPDNAIVTINFTENDPQSASTQFKMQIEGYDEETFDYASLPIVKNIPKNAQYNITFRSICTGGILGKKVTDLIDTDEGIDPPPGPEENNSLIINNTSNPTAFIVDINAMTFAAGSVGSNTNKRLGLADDNPDAQVVATISDFRPATVRLISNAVVYTPTIVNSGAGVIATFTHVNITAGFNIAIS